MINVALWNRIDVKLKEAAETVTGSDSVSSLNDHAMLHEEHEGTLGPVSYAMLSEAKDSTSHHQM